ncbi:MAG: hypothetical protein DRR19_24135 [Candidatus Parabeggiatoa sp. nov. 1]|nr:MAG: hypothetical protein DRR19_24135 [Gammaproteobacteria bacterium]
MYETGRDIYHLKINWAARCNRIEHNLCVALDHGDNESNKSLFAFWNQGRITPSLRGFEEGTLSPERAYAVAKYL